MLHEKIFTTIIVLSIITLVVYLYYNCDSGLINKSNNADKYTIKLNNNNLKPIINNKKSPNIRKKVRFDDNIQYYEYSDKKSKTNLRGASRLDTPYPRIVENFNSSSMDEERFRDSDVSDDIISSIVGNTFSLEKQELIKNDTPIINKKVRKIIPSNYTPNNPNIPWDSSFGIPLMDKQEKADYFVRIMNNHKKFNEGMGKFFEYQTDNSTVVKTDITIDPFKPSVRSGSLKGKAVSDIYDEQVKGPEAVPKKIKSEKNGLITYEDESDMNGGIISGSDLRGFSGYGDFQQSATFGNGF